MEFVPTTLPDIILLKPKIFGDDRGFFMETYRENTFKDMGITTPFVQDNHSLSQKNILRGLHYQLKKPQGKVVRVITGSVYDVVVDLRRSSTHFGKWFGIILSEENKYQLWIPPGFAHGMYVLEDKTQFTYKCTNYYAPDDEHSLLWNDPALGIVWPLLNTSPILSDKDQKGLPLDRSPVYP